MGRGWAEARRLDRGAQHVGWGGARSLRSAATKPNTFVVVQFPRMWWFDLRSLGFAALNANLPNANLPGAPGRPEGGRQKCK